MKSDHHGGGHKELFIPLRKVDGASTGPMVDQVAFVMFTEHQSYGYLQVFVVSDVIGVRNFLADNGVENLDLCFVYRKMLGVVDRDVGSRPSTT